MLMSTKPPLLAEPIEIRFWKNRQRRAAIVVSLKSFEDQNLIDVREYFTDAQGCMKPSTKGIAMGVRCLPELSRSVRRALEKARALKLIPEDAGE
jgi:transcriptional coactivator p15 (PC4)